MTAAFHRDLPESNQSFGRYEQATFGDNLHGEARWLKSMQFGVTVTPVTIDDAKKYRRAHFWLWCATCAFTKVI